MDIQKMVNSRQNFRMIRQPPVRHHETHATNLLQKRFSRTTLQQTAPFFKTPSPSE
jgi:hypothetical protein